MIDIHILYTEWHLKTFGSLLRYNQTILEKEGISIRLIECTDRRISYSRSQAMQKSSTDYVGWIDIDDMYVPLSYAKMLSVAACEKLPFVWMNELMVVVDNCQVECYYQTNKYPHHAHIIHKDIIDWYYLENNPEITTPDRWVSRMTAHGKHIDECGYIWRRRMDGLSFALKGS